jgi:uncharacterized protein
MLDLPPPWRDIIQQAWATHIPDCEVWAYGSRVKGMNHAASDVDLVVIHRETKKASMCSAIAPFQAALQESALPISVDVLDWATLTAEMQHEISQHKVRLF